MKSSDNSLPEEVEQICYSFRSGNEENAKELLERYQEQHHPDPLKRSKKIVKAVEGGHLEDVRKLLKERVDVNTTTKGFDSKSDTILYKAAHHGHEGIVKLLLENEADANLANNRGFTPLHIAAYKGYKEIVEMLLKHGAKILDDNHGSTPLHYSFKDAEITRLLLANGADVDQRDNYGNTALRSVFYYDGKPEVVKVLLDEGININARNRDGKTAAEFTNSEEIKRLLKKEEERLEKKEEKEESGKSAERNNTWKSSDTNFESLGRLDVAGQGAVGLKCHVRKDGGVFSLRFVPDDNGSIALTCQMDQSGWSLEAYSSEATPVKQSFRPSPNTEKKRNINECSGRRKTYWVSIDKQRRIVRVGTGYLLRALQEAEFVVPKEQWENYKMSNLQKYCINDPQKNIDGDIDVISSKNPIYRDLPPLVKERDEITMAELDAGSAITAAELSKECQLLYSNVAGNRIELNTDDFRDFAAAIDNSLKDPNGICHKKLIDKASVFVGSTEHYNANQQYLRITMGPPRGDSPGVPYVMEIWPPGCYSPIHDHSNANAVIKVLSGSLTTYWHGSLHKEDREPYGYCRMYAGDVTWLDDRQFQTHRLWNHNINGSACVTIQSYRYNDDDNTHYEYFDYVKEGDEDIIQQFNPNSDWDFETFKNELKKEWETFSATAKIAPKIEKIPRQG